ncbi:MAG: 23S rRNA (adenine(2503)-C(2))-methyltransferase RlmN [Anaerolineae bacterium]|nr:23S rRNA (adenine(2503)-C(2))-methyltransferase RlmN [Anaerolineae bacterium]MDW8070650.1 23S rRNA (adenine(2503)-C(2))-methyltransferase RlmN [Anaerolineae bacterium]
MKTFLPEALSYEQVSPLQRPSMLDLDKPQLQSLLEAWGEPAYRVQQVWHGLYRQLAATPEALSNLPKALRLRLGAETIWDPLTPLETLHSRDGQTHKVLFALPDGAQVEAVLMNYARRHTVCVSTQAGCAMGCSFCATGQSGFQRNLSAGEIVAQVLYFARQVAVRRERITNVVLMGMGEPLANYEATWAAIRRLNDPEGFGLGARAMTLSTVGLVPGIRRMAHEPEQVNLAVSLHAANDALRDQLVPINRRFPLAQLLEACRYYIAQTRRRVSFEYALIAEVNDRDEDAHQLAELLTGLLAHVNLIPLNPIPDSPLRPSPRARVQAFQHILQQHHITCTVRLRRGLDIQAGCGQLRLRRQQEENRATRAIQTE